MNLQNDLTEREKELDCLYSMAKLLTSGETDTLAIISSAAGFLKNAVTHPEKVSVNITAGEEHFGSNAPETVSALIHSEKIYNDGIKLAVKLWYSSEDLFVEREKKLVESVSSLLANAISRNTYLRKLEEQAQELEGKNTALREILYQIRKDREDFITAVKQSAGTFIQPLICELEGSVLNHRQSAILNQLKVQIESLVTEPVNSMKQFADILTPRELEICSLVKNGEATKDIAALLGIAPLTVERHRNTIRKKLGISKKGINLISFLRNRY
ncbi:MAG: hypothetical protein H7A26_02170 [Spirochaetales bacterium]|nr:hypothetical protein [Spirochaetales bacterium]